MALIRSGLWADSSIFENFDTDIENDDDIVLIL